MSSCDGKNQPYIVKSSHKREDFLKINFLSLDISLRHESSYMLDDIFFTIILQLKHSLQTDGLVFVR